MPPIKLPSNEQVRDGLREHYETNHVMPEHPEGEPLPEVADHPDEDPDERI